MKIFDYVYKWFHQGYTPEEIWEGNYGVVDITEKLHQQSEQERVNGQQDIVDGDTHLH